ncbi:MAG: tetratricopeptide repeat protein [Nibricoccus sp.]
MKKTLTFCLLCLLALRTISAYGWEYADAWPIEGGNFQVKVGSWISATHVWVLEGPTDTTAKLYRNQTAQSAPTIVKPKPRPRLGASPKVEERGDTPSSHEQRIFEISQFLAALSNQFADPWNAPRQASEATQWVHEIELECILAVDKQSGMLAIESLTNSPETTGMIQIRQSIEPYNEPNAIYGKANPTGPAEINRFKDFLRSFAPLKLPEGLVSLPGKSLRMRLAVKVVKISSTAGNPTSPPPPPTPIAEANPDRVFTAAASLDSSGATSTYTHNPGEFTRPIAPEELRNHTDVADPVYQYVIGFRYLEGDGLEKDYVLATHWFTKAAEQGYAPAQQQLGFMYALNYGVPRNYEKALYWYRKAADQNYILAIFNLSTFYFNGEGVKRDLAEAARWMRKGAELGDPGCQTQLAGHYAKGEGVTKDPVQAFHWYMEAALQGNTYAQFNIGSMYEHGEGIPKDEVEALAWYNLSPTNGVDEKNNHRDRLERMLGSEKAAEARLRSEKLRQKIKPRA